ncbi:MAG: hypothetical protein ABF449_09295 [Ethanoligenens sp.]
MNLIHFRGLNCYHDCIVTIAASLGLDYRASFATLWSETDFIYDPHSKVYLTKRMIANLQTLGAKLEKLDCSSPENMKESLSQFKAGEWIIIGTDTFYIPWTRYYHTLYNTHHFMVRKERDGSLSCADPTCGRQDMRITFEEIIPHIFDIKRVRRVAEKPLNFGAIREARAVLRSHPEMRKSLLEKMNGCTGAKQEDAGLLARYISAMIDNRYLFRHYLQTRPSASNQDRQLFSDEFFLRWTAVKNGLFKASLIRPNESVLRDVCGRAGELVDEEIAMAEKMIETASKHGDSELGLR